jgi:DNA-binding transcriptional ArsR family regulator
MATKKEREKRRKTLRPHAVRDRIVDALRSCDSPLSPAQLARITGETLGSTAYHVRTLVAAGVVELVDEGRVRGAVEHFYALVSEAGSDIRTIDPIDQLVSLCGALILPGETGGQPRRAVLDDEARMRLVTILETVRPQVVEIVSESTERAG